MIEKDAPRIEKKCLAIFQQTLKASALVKKRLALCCFGILILLLVVWWWRHNAADEQRHYLVLGPSAAGPG